MKKLILILAIFGITHAEESKPEKYSFGYFDVGAIYFLPTIGFGYRWQNGHFGADLSLEGATAFAAHTLFGNLRGLYFIKPDERSFYLGLGIGAGGAHVMHQKLQGFYSPQAIFGYKLSQRQFFEVDLHFPQDLKSSRLHAHTVPVFRYGFGF